MTPDVNEFLTTIVLVSFLVTIVLAVGSYVAYKLRERRRPPAMKPTTGPMFFERFVPENRTLQEPPNDARVS